MGLDKISNVGIEGERIGVASRWLGSPSMASLDMSSLNSSQCPIWEYRCFLRGLFLRGFKLYSLEGLL
jgi:hypothetical protein